MAVTYIHVPTPVKRTLIQAFIHWGLFMISFNANTSPLPLPYCFRICLMLWRLGYMSLLALIFGSLRMYRETYLFNVVAVWLRASYVSMIVRLCPVMDRFTIISRISSGSDSSLTSSATSSPFCSFSCCSSSCCLSCGCCCCCNSSSCSTCFSVFVTFCSSLESTTSSSIPFS